MDLRYLAPPAYCPCNMNHIIYFSINKEEFEDYESSAKANIEPILLAIFTFRWPKDYRDNEEKTTKILMRVGNVLGPLFVSYTVMVFLAWVFTHGR